MKNHYRRTLAVALCATLSVGASAQLSSNPDKFLGNITTYGQVDYEGVVYSTLWNEITPENETKWESIEGNGRGIFNWDGADRSYNYAKEHGFPFKFHCLIWGAQYPSWMNSLSTNDQHDALVEWYDAVKEHYNTIDLIDVVNEAIKGHQPAPFRNALGGEGKTGYDWIIRAFEMAHERWPEAILIYNDYNSVLHQRKEFIDLVKTLRDAGAPIDAYGLQSHDLNATKDNMTFDLFKKYFDELNDSLLMPAYSTEYDIDEASDDVQLRQYKDQIPYMWEKDYFAGLTLWGYVFGRTWVDNSGIVRNPKNGTFTERPAYTWLKEYMASDAAKNAKSPFPNFKKEASVYIAPYALRMPVNEPVPVTVKAELHNGKTIASVALYANGELVSTLTSAPYVFSYNPTKEGYVRLNAVVTDTDNKEYKRVGGVTIHSARSPYAGAIAMPGTLEAENFDNGQDGITFHDNDSKNSGGNEYRENVGGVDFMAENNGVVISNTFGEEWLEYTVDVKEAGLYEYEVVAAATSKNANFNILLSDGSLLETLASVKVPYDEDKQYKSVVGRFSQELTAGKHVIRIAFVASGTKLDKINLKHVNINKGITAEIKMDAEKIVLGESLNITVQTSVSATTDQIAKVDVYVAGALAKSMTTAPYTFAYKAESTGTFDVRAIAFDANGFEAPEATATFVVKPPRSPYATVTIPGVIEAENFDAGGEGDSFHDSDEKDEGAVGYRADNEGVDIVTGNKGYAIGYTAAGEWLEYTVNVAKTANYEFRAVVSSGSDGSAFTIALMNNGKATSLARVNVPNGGSWDTYKAVNGKLSKQLEAGEQVIRFTINGAYCNIDKVYIFEEGTTPDAIADVVSDQISTYNVYTTAGILVGQVTANAETIKEALRVLTGDNGLYVVKNVDNGAAKLMSTY
ncbi:MAG: endo-1,4-beta-xylanase [Salinivirgaceae bacterium]|nr:endo-1,4-beta-xylanase [Salinivirgaceae bacterium]